jgi:hypothetical protein
MKGLSQYGRDRRRRRHALACFVAGVRIEELADIGSFRSRSSPVDDDPQMWTPLCDEIMLDLGLLRQFATARNFN